MGMFVTHKPATAKKSAKTASLGIASNATADPLGDGLAADPLQMQEEEEEAMQMQEEEEEAMQMQEEEEEMQAKADSSVQLVEEEEEMQMQEEEEEAMQAKSDPVQRQDEDDTSDDENTQGKFVQAQDDDASDDDNVQEKVQLQDDDPDDDVQSKAVQLDDDPDDDTQAKVQAKADVLKSPKAKAKVADQGFEGPAGQLPHFDTVQEAFGKHDVSNVQAHVGGAADETAEKMGALAYAKGDKVAFRNDPSLHTAAHEAAHIVQQRGGVSLKDGIGRVGDPYEVHADKVADAVVAGKNVEGMLNPYAGSEAAAAPAQMKKKR